MNINTLTIILNWNGSSDTIACLDSIHIANHVDEDILIVDNNSNLEDYNNLKKHLFELADTYISSGLEEVSKEFVISEQITFSLAAKKVYLLRANTNYGFAKACNAGAMLANSLQYESINFLNNDTEVVPGYLDIMRSAIDSDSGISAVIPQIRYHSDKTKIWNCGGDISKFGNRKYHYSMCLGNEINFQKPYFKVTFATGCCILFKTKFFKEIGMFTERFFFGEEDIELSLRLKRYKAKMVCTPNALIYHKVGASISGSPEKIVRKAYIHYLNRFINMKLYLKGFWWFWLLPSLAKVFINLIRLNNLSFNQAVEFITNLFFDAKKYDEVSKDKFESILNTGYQK